jgi:indole-3-glycerol phosphate synthase
LSFAPEIVRQSSILASDTTEGTVRMSNILEEIVAKKRQEIEQSRAKRPDAELEKAVAALPPARDFLGALRRPDELRVIAEVKKASPSAGVIRADFDPVSIAEVYFRQGADCISVLTDEPFFQGKLDHLYAIRAAVPSPLLRKDFILDRYQLLEARVAGADAVLLIAEILPGNQLRELYDAAVALKLHVLIEAHDADQLGRALETGTPLIGINNRDLRTFATKLETTLELAPRVPADRLIVSESGIRTGLDVARLRAVGVKAILVGEQLLRSKDIGVEIARLRGWLD